MMARSKNSGQIRVGARLRRVGARTAGPQAAQRLGTRVAIECLPSNLHNKPRDIPEAVRAKLEEGQRQLRRDLRRIHGLWNRRAPRRGARRVRHRAASGRPLLRVLRGRRALRGSSRSGERNLLLDGLHGPPIRCDRDPRPRTRSSPSSSGPSTSKTTGASYTWLRQILQKLAAKARRCAEQLGLEFETCFTGLDSFHRTLPIERDRSEALEESR